MKKAFTKNIKTIFLLCFLRNFALCDGIANLFLIEKGFTLANFAVYFTLKRASQMFFEVPVGYLINLIGRRRALQISRIAVISVYLLIVLAPNPSLLFFTAILGGLSNAFYSDTDTSIIFDDLKKHRLEKLYPKLIAHYNMLALAAFAIASVIGATLADHFNMALTFYLTIPVYIIHLFLAGRLTETKQISQHTKRALFSPFNVFQTGFKNIVSNKKLLVIIYFSSLMAAFNLIIWDYMQNYGEQIDLPLYAFGWLTLAFSLAEGIPQYLSYKFLRPKNFSLLFTILSIIIAISGLASSFLANGLGLIILAIAIIITGFSFPISDALFHHFVPSKERNILCSFNSLIQMLAYSICILIFGTIADHYNLFTALTFLSGLVLLTSVIYLITHFVKPRRR